MTELAQNVTGMAGIRAWRLPRWSYARCYSYIAVPILISLCFVTGPFRVADEPAHFYRAIQLSHGYFRPVLGPARNSAGGFIDLSAVNLVGKLETVFIDQTPVHRVLFGDVVAEWNAGYASGGLCFTAFNNTVIYFPIAHAIPAMTIAVARWLGAPPLAWLYLARLTNALAAVAVSTFAISLFEESGLFAMVFCSLPMVFFEEASLAADALVIPFSVLLAALVARIARNTELGEGFFVALFISLLYVTVAKLAYIPLVLLPPLVGIIQKRNSHIIFLLMLVSFFVALAWIFWSLDVHDEVFTIDTHPGIVDVHRQLHIVLQHPLMFPLIIFRSLDNVRALRRLVEEVVGSNLGWLHLSTPKILVAVFLVNFGTAAAFRSSITPLLPASRVLTLILLLGSFISIYLLLYLQYTPLGQSTVYGIQGRYMLPLLAFLPLVLPGWKLREISAHRLSAMLALSSEIAGMAALIFVWSVCWTSR